MQIILHSLNDRHITPTAFMHFLATNYASNNNTHVIGTGMFSFLLAVSCNKAVIQQANVSPNTKQTKAKQKNKKNLLNERKSKMKQKKSLENKIACKFILAGRICVAAGSIYILKHIIRMPVLQHVAWLKSSNFSCDIATTVKRKSVSAAS